MNVEIPRVVPVNVAVASEVNVTPTPVDPESLAIDSED